METNTDRRTTAPIPFGIGLVWSLCYTHQRIGWQTEGVSVRLVSLAGVEAVWSGQGHQGMDGNRAAIIRICQSGCTLPNTSPEVIAITVTSALRREALAPRVG